MPVAIVFVRGDGLVGTLAAAIGEGVIDEARLEGRAYHRAQRVMHHAITERSGGDEALLRVIHFDDDVAAWPVAAVLKLTLKGQQLTFKISGKGRRAGLLALALDRAPVRGVKRLKTGDATKQSIMPPRHCEPSSSRRSGGPCH